MSADRWGPTPAPPIERIAEIAIVDYGMGNRRSVEKALERVGASVTMSSDPAVLARADGLVLPGVGAFPRAMERLEALGLDEFLREGVAGGTPLLGICLGMQLAFDSSEELGGAAGLGLIPGEVLRLAPPAGLKLPHIGWSEVGFGHPSSLTEELPERCAFYHVHSFAPRPVDRRDILGTADYGGPFVSVVSRGSFQGVQFHPEKSSAAGLRLLLNFTRSCLLTRVPGRD
jgi:imidazole glycerol-phosphate synthase subunit HisH